MQCLIAVAEIDNGIVASGLVHIREGKSYNTHKQYAYFGAMYVHPSQRGKGINQQIIEVLKQFALLRGITELRLEVYPGNAPAIKAYQKVDFAPHLLQMRMRL